MKLTTLIDRFYSLVAPDLPNEWDVEEAIENLVGLDEEKCRSVLDHVRVIWPVSHSLCFDYLKMAASALDCIELNTLSEWVNRSLDQYEKSGLRAAQRYMADVEENFLCTLRGESALQFFRIERKLGTYLRGLSGRQLDLDTADTIFTDTTTVFVPDEITWLKNESDDFFLYKLIASYQWAFIAESSYTFSPLDPEEKRRDDFHDNLWMQKFLSSFAVPELAGDIYHFLETVRITAFLRRELPGLMRRKQRYFADTDMVYRFCDGGKCILARLQKLWFAGLRYSGSDAVLRRVISLVAKHENNAQSPYDSVILTGQLYEMISSQENKYIPVVPLFFQGEMRLESVRAERNKRIGEVKNQFIDALATRIIKQVSGNSQNGEQKTGNEAESGQKVQEDGVALIIDSQQNNKSPKNEQETVSLTINNESVDVGEELEQAVSDVLQELGYLPERYISSAVGKAGNGYAAFRSAEEEKGNGLIAPVTYDEWDYRRGDFRKNWCSLREKEIPLSRSTFLNDTLVKYHGQIIRLRYQFEMMRNRERFLRRQRDGEDIDLDALVESLADSRAGLAPSDRLFISLRRDERDIAVLFLVDMSNSTQGWVGKVIKESLVLLCEALEVVGDRYAIYGFSGMRRLRSEFFHVKHLDEPYDDSVKQRICSIGPREYTRMGPAIRHATTLLKKVESRAKLLITLSDGKPEDYDDYKGEYAIEDTRHALIEAKQLDIHPFCITIDKQAHDYIERMYGDVNYILIDDAVKLPLRIPEIYRILTH